MNIYDVTTLFAYDELMDAFRLFLGMKNEAELLPDGWHKTHFPAFKKFWNKFPHRHDEMMLPCAGVDLFLQKMQIDNISALSDVQLNAALAQYRRHLVNARGFN